MKEKDFDRIIREKFSGKESSFSEHIWGNIEKELDKTQAVRPLPYFAGKNLLLLASMMIILSVVGYNLYNIYTKDTTKESEIKTIDQQLSVPKSAGKDIATVETQIPELSSSTQNISAKTEKLYSAEISTKNQYASNTTSKNFTTSISKQTKQIANNSNHQLNAGNNANLLNGQSDISQNSVAVAQESFLPHEDVYVNSLTKQKIMSVESSQATTGPIFGIIPDPKGSCPKFRTNVPEYFLELFMSPDLHHTYLSTDDVEMASYLDSRKNSETAMLGYSAGIRAGMVFRNGLTVKTGMNYSSVNYRFDYKKEDVEILKYKVVPSDTIHGNGTVAYVFDTIAYVEKGIRTVKHFNTLSSIEVPFWIGYHKEFTRWTLGLHTGASLQLASMKSGKVLSASSPYEPVEYTDDVNGHYNLYKRTFGIGLLGSAQFGYKLTPNHEFIVEPYIKYYPSSITVQEYPLKQRLLVYGINLGLKLKI